MDLCLLQYASGMKEQYIEQRQIIRKQAYDVHHLGGHELTRQAPDSYANQREGVLFMGEPGGGEIDKGQAATTGKSPELKYVTVIDRKDASAREGIAGYQKPASGDSVNGRDEARLRETLQAKVETFTNPEDKRQYLETLESVASLRDPDKRQEAYESLGKITNSTQTWAQNEIKEEYLRWMIQPHLLSRTPDDARMSNISWYMLDEMKKIAGEKFNGGAEKLTQDISTLAKEIGGVISAHDSRVTSPEQQQQLLSILQKYGYDDLSQELFPRVILVSNSSPAEVPAVGTRVETVASEEAMVEDTDILEKLRILAGEIKDPSIRREAEDFLRLASSERTWTDEELQSAYLKWEFQPDLVSQAEDRVVVTDLSTNINMLLLKLAGERSGPLLNAMYSEVKEIRRSMSGVSYGDLLFSDAVLSPEARANLLAEIDTKRRRIAHRSLTSGTPRGRGGDAGGDTPGGEPPDRSDGAEDAGSGGETERDDPYRIPLSIEELAIEIGIGDEDKWGPDGTHPLYSFKKNASGEIVTAVVDRTTYDPRTGEVVIDKDKELGSGKLPLPTDKIKRECIEIHPENFIYWMRSQMIYYLKDSPDSKHDFFQLVGLKIRPGKSISSIAIGEMLHKKEQFFRTRSKADNEKFEYEDLVEQMKREMYAMMMVQTERVTLEAEGASTNERSLTETYAKLKMGNPLTKKVWGDTSILAWVFSLPERYKENPNRLSIDEAEAATGLKNKVARRITREGMRQDGKLGKSINSALLFYKHINDYKKLVQLFERDMDGHELDLKTDTKFTAPIFTWSGFRAAIDQRLDQNLEFSTETYLTNDEAKAIFGMTIAELDSKLALDEDGKPQGKDTYIGQGFATPEAREGAWKAYIKYINFYKDAETDPRHMEVVRNLIKQTMAERYDMKIKDKFGNEIVDSVNVDYAETYAFNMPRSLFIAAQNDTARQAADAGVKAMHPMLYRIRSIGGLGKDNSRLRGRSAGNPYNTFMIKDILTDFTDAARTDSVGTRMEPVLEWDRKNKKWKQKIDSDGNPVMESKPTNKTMYQIMLELHNDTLEETINETDSDDEKARKEQTNAARRVHIANQLSFPANTERDYAANYVNQAFSMYAWLNEAEGIDWSKIEDKSTLTKGVTLNRSAFQKEVLDKFLKPWSTMFTTWSQTDLSQLVRAEVLSVDERGKFTGDTEFVTIPMAQRLFGYEILDWPQFHREGTPKGSRSWETIDWNIVNSSKGRDILFANVVTGLLAAEVWRARDMLSYDPAHDNFYWEDMYQAIQSIPTYITGDDIDMRHVQALGKFFDKQRTNWIRKKTGTERWKFYSKELGKLGSDPKMFWTVLKQIFSGLL